VLGGRVGVCDIIIYFAFDKLGQNIFLIKMHIIYKGISKKNNKITTETKR
jgi:hypothetical protein